MGFFSNIFGKKNCALCNKECGVMKRTKIRDKLFICDECGDKCSRYIRLSELTLDEVKGHIDYMARIKRLYEQVFANAVYQTVQYPSPATEMGIKFCDDLGMLLIVDKTSGRGDMPELIRYDQIASYSVYVDETAAQEPGKEPTFNGGGLKIKLVGSKDLNGTDNRKGMRPHPYIKNEITICFSKRDKRVASYADNAKAHLDVIFGVHDDEKGLFNFGMSKAEKRDLMGAVGMVKAMGTVAKAAMNGGEESLTDEQKAQLQQNFNAVDDAQSGGLAVYSRRADEAEARIN